MSLASLATRRKQIPQVVLVPHLNLADFIGGISRAGKRLVIGIGAAYTITTAGVCADDDAMAMTQADHHHPTTGQ